MRFTAEHKNLSQIFADDSDDASRTPHDELEFGSGNIEAIRHTCEAVGSTLEQWGFKKTLGMIWAFLYLCPEPASAKDICSALKVSPALVSITIQDLLRWGAVRKMSGMGRRRDYYEAERDIWKMIKRVINEREIGQLRLVQKRLEMAINALDRESNNNANLKSKRTCQFQKMRIEDLKSVSNAAESLLGTFAAHGLLQVNPLALALNPIRT